MDKRFRGERGRYVKKGGSERKVRSVRLTDEVWQNLNRLAGDRQITVADLLESHFSGDVLHGKNTDLIGVVEILEQALKLKPNAGGAIKSKIKEVLEIMRDSM